MSELIGPMLPKRPTDGHKGTFGTVGIFGGSAGGSVNQETISARMIGAPAMVAMGANRAGCGLVKVATPEPILNAVLTLAPMATGYPIQTLPDDVMASDQAHCVLGQLLEDSDAMVIGPGLGTRRDAQDVIEGLFKIAASSRSRTIVLDADAITVLSMLGVSRDMISDVESRLVLTPHPGEARRLLDALDIHGNPDGSTKERTDTCIALSQATGAVVVLKGRGTVVADNSRRWICSSGDPCLGTGGTGDVLAGIIASLAAQFQNRFHEGIDLFDLVCIAVETHARCGERWASLHSTDAGLDPRDLGPLIPQVLREYRIG